jgi:hypothetical protein
MGRTAVIARALGLDKSFLERGFGQAGRGASDADDVVLPNFSAIKAAAHTSIGEPEPASPPKTSIMAKGNMLIDAAARKSAAEPEAETATADAGQAGKTDGASPSIAAADRAQAEERNAGEAEAKNLKPASAGAATSTPAAAQVSPAVQSNVAALFARLGEARPLGTEPPKVDETKMVMLLAELDRIWGKSKAERGSTAA